MYTREDMLSAMRLIADTTVDVASLVTKILPLEQAAEAFAAADAGSDIKVHLKV
jgi:threonine dehydrogenase-like Zn-dependent dehydrogenase